jgi:hypothetical protein
VGVVSSQLSAAGTRTSFSQNLTCELCNDTVVPGNSESFAIEASNLCWWSLTYHKAMSIVPLAPILKVQLCLSVGGT